MKQPTFAPGYSGRLSLLAVGLALVLFASACVAHVRPAPVRAGAAVKVRSGHVHTDRCGHYRSGRTWYLVRGHVHQRGCGHVYRKGVWVGRR